MSDGAPEQQDELVLVQASKHGAWQGAVLPAVAAVFFLAVGIGLPGLDMILPGVAFALFAVARAAWWARAVSTSQLVDRGDSLVWLYRGKVRRSVAWSDLRHVLFQRYARHVFYAIGPRDGGPFPYVLIDSRADRPPPGFRTFAELMIIRRIELEAADRAFAEACRRHGVTYHGIDSNW